MLACMTDTQITMASAWSRSRVTPGRAFCPEQNRPILNRAGVVVFA
jgi:hypothetical protein